MPNIKTRSVQTSSTTEVTGKANLVKVLFFGMESRSLKIFAVLGGIISLSTYSAVIVQCQHLVGFSLWEANKGIKWYINSFGMVLIMYNHFYKSKHGPCGKIQWYQDRYLRG